MSPIAPPGNIGAMGDIIRAAPEYDLGVGEGDT